MHHALINSQHSLIEKGKYSITFNSVGCIDSIAICFDNGRGTIDHLNLSGAEMQMLVNAVQQAYAAMRR